MRMDVLQAPSLLEKSGSLNDLMILVTSGILNVFSTLMLLGCLSEVSFLGMGSGCESKDGLSSHFYQGLRRVVDGEVGSRKDSSNPR